MSLLPQQSHKGFTLVETLVAISILLIIVTSVMTVAVQGLQMAFFANDQTTAVYLAQEAIESIETLRDENALAVFYNLTGAQFADDDSWDWNRPGAGSIVHVCRSSSKCDYDITKVDDPDGFRQCTVANPCTLWFDKNAPTKYFYTHDDSTSGDAVISKYTREINIKKQNNPDAVEVTVTVSWATSLFGAGGTNEVKLKTWLYDHYDRYE